MVAGVPEVCSRTAAAAAAGPVCQYPTVIANLLAFTTKGMTTAIVVTTGVVTAVRTPSSDFI